MAPTIDLARTLDRLRGDRTLVAELIGLYLEDFGPLCDAASSSLDSGDRPGLARAAHSLRGMAATFDADRVVRVAESVERHAANDPPSELTDLVSRMRLECDSLAAALSEWLRIRPA